MTVRRSLIALLALAASSGLLAAAAPEAEEGLGARAVRIFSPALRQIERRLAGVERELTSLPSLLEGPLADRYGFRSQTLGTQDNPEWVQVDLGQPRSVDRLVVVPAHVPRLGQRGEGYGFPRRFRIEVADNPEMENSTVVVDRTAEDVPHPGRYPLFFRADPVEGRYVRFTSTRHFPVEDGFLWALQELLILDGNSAVGVQRPATASSNLELFPHWSLARLNDGQSVLGTPSSTAASPTKGYLSASGATPNETKWLSIDLGKRHELDEIRCVAAEGEDVELLGGRGFPRTIEVQLSNDPDFEAIVWRGTGGSGRVLGFPGGCPQVIPVTAPPARYLRLVTQELWSRGDQHFFALAEVQAYAGGRNVARGGTVRASDAIDRPASSGWSPAFVLDGYSSRHPLREYPAYLEQLEKQVTLSRERDGLLAQRSATARTVRKWLSRSSITIVAAACLAILWLFARQRNQRRFAVTRLRDQIARDLHDDIGSNLGGIVLLSEMGSRHSQDPRAREDFATIHEAAEETVQSMQDIVWLIQRSASGLKDLVTRMRQSTETLLGDLPVEFTCQPEEIRNRTLSLLFRRHVFLAFKESLNNIRRHARANAVAITVTVEQQRFRFEVVDDGVGFSMDREEGSGHGLRNLQRRGDRLKGSVRIDSAPGQGTRIRFEAPLKS